MGKNKQEEEVVVVDAPPWHVMTKEDVIKELGLQPNLQKEGLSTQQAEERLQQYGPNQLTEGKKETLLQRIWNLVANVLVGILVVVAIVSLVRAATSTDSTTITTNAIQVGIILLVIIINTAIGLYQEGSAAKAAEALKAMLASDAVVVRNGQEQEIETKFLVPGDIVKLNTGDRIPADIRLIEVAAFACAEAALTGESVPIDKMSNIIEVHDKDPKAVPLGDRKNMAYSSTLVSQGSATGIVVSTGDHTEIGTINALVSKVEKKKTNVLKQIDHISKWLAFFIILCAIATFFVAWKRSNQSAIDALSTALVAAVAMIPEGLEAIVTVVYAYAVSKMAEENAIIRALPAVETLGSVTVICSDKTGTLTQNIMSMVAFVTSDKRYRVDVNSRDKTPTNFVEDPTYLAEKASLEQLQKGKDENATSASTVTGASPDSEYLRQALCGGVLCSKCVLGENGGREGEIGNPTELAILRAAYFGNVDVSGLKDTAPIVAEVPFSSEYKFMATVHDPNPINDGPLGASDEYVVHVKGAPDRMVAMCNSQAKGGDLATIEPIESDKWQEQIAILSSHGLRVLALTRGTIKKSEIKPGDQLSADFVKGRGGPWLTIVGLCAIMDPPRPECVEAIKVAHRAGVRVAMITGDHRDTALAIGGMLGLVDEQHSQAIIGPELDAIAEDEEKIRAEVQKYNVFARASPQNKIQIVKALQAEGEVAGMTGDGVNDAPALKAADMGVAMGKEGTDVAREAAEMILADDNFATIMVAVKQGRVVWDNLRKVLLVNTPINNAQGLSVLFGLICGADETPLSSIQVLYSNLICAVTLGFVCAVEPAEDGIMDLPPRRVGKRLIGRFLFLRIILGTTILTTSVVGAYFWARSLGYPSEKRRATACTCLNIGAISVTLSARKSYNPSYTPKNLFDNKYMWIAAVIVVLLQVAIVYIPGLNKTVFQQGPMDGKLWGICILFMVCIFIIMETEKAIRRVLMKKGMDTEDREYGIFDEESERIAPQYEAITSEISGSAALNTQMKK